MEWVTISYNIDLETGEKISKSERDNNYIIIKTIKNVKKRTETFGIIEYTVECRRKPKQGKLEL